MPRPRLPTLRRRRRSQPTSSSPSPSPSRIAAAARNPALDLDLQLNTAANRRPPASFALPRVPEHRHLCASPSPPPRPPQRRPIRLREAPCPPPSSRVPAAYDSRARPDIPRSPAAAARALVVGIERVGCPPPPDNCTPQVRHDAIDPGRICARVRITTRDVPRSSNAGASEDGANSTTQRRTARPPCPLPSNLPPLRKHAQSPSLHLARRRRRRSQRHPPPLPTKSRRRPSKRLRRKRAIPRRRANSFRGDGA
ncbi:hypothetical protein B0H15DRAFT_1024847 [Mycena belliarum]|uniref:Uncharacterized protein n=1 Tax=Mycena belliarum TaxID=1033014 RepID=A0AAD6TW17_9AGAR|nr:hypothetical protein B0H15DRAFT_1024847 [Mycena belliae]